MLVPEHNARPVVPRVILSRMHARSFVLVTPREERTKQEGCRPRDDVDEENRNYEPIAEEQMTPRVQLY